MDGGLARASLESRAREWLPFGTVVAAWFLITHRIWLFGETYYFRDFWLNYVPQRQLLRRLLMSLELPVWNPWIGSGLPLLPDPNNSILYLPGWPFLLPADQGWALSANVALHLLLAAAGAFLLARRSVDPWGAAASAAVFGLGGPMLSNMVNVHWHFAYAWIPFWFLLLLRLIDTSSLRTLGLLIVVWTLQLVAAEPQTCYLEGAAAVALVLARLRRNGGAAVARGLGMVFAAGAITVLLGSMQVLAMLEARGQTGRGLLTDAEASVFHFHFLRAWELLLPMPWGEVLPVTHFFGRGVGGGPWDRFYFISTYVGCLTPVWIYFGWRGATRGRAVEVAGALLLLVASLGDMTPVHGWLRAVLPLWGGFRYPERLIILPLLGLAIVVGHGIDACAKMEPPPRWRAAVIGAPILLGLVALGGPRLLGPSMAEPDAYAGLVAAYIHLVLVSLVALAVLLLVRPPWRVRGLVWLLAADLVLFSVGVHATWEPPQAQSPPVTDGGRVLYWTADVQRAINRILPADFRERRRFEDALARPNLSTSRGVRTADGQTSVELWRVRDLRQGIGREPAEIRRGTHHIIAAQGAPLRQYDHVADLPNGLARYSLPESERPPWVDCPASYQSVAESEAAIALLRADATAVAEGEACVPPENRVVAACTVRAVERVAANEISVSLDPIPSPALLRLHESYYPGWRAETDNGTVVSPCPVDVASVGFLLPAGTERVRILYRPTWLGAGSLLTAVGALVWVGLWLWPVLMRARINRRRRQTP